MSLTINRSKGLLGQRLLNETQKNKQRSFARLSSGLRINSAKDDAAGLSIATRLGSNFRGLDMAMRNANDGISMTQTAEGALGGITENLQRMRELAVQASNGTLTSSDRDSIQAEMSQLSDEIDRVSETTTFNGRKLLNGSGGTVSLQVGPNSGDTISMAATDARTTNLGKNAQVSASVKGGGLNSGDLALNGSTVRGTTASDDTFSTSNANESAISLAAAINDSTSTSGVTATVNETAVSGGAIQGGTLDSTNTLTINDVSITGIEVAADDGGDTLISAINAQTDNTGVVAQRNADGNLELTASDGRNIDVQTTGDASQFTGLATGVTTGSVTISADDAFTISGDDPGAANLTAGTRAVSPDTSIENVNVSSQSGADDAIARIDRALEEVSSRRSSMGAIQNRLESTLNNLSVASENTQFAQSRIQDADFAKEAAELLRQRILERSSIAMSGQANVSQQAALQLLN